MARTSKRYQALVAQVDRSKLYPVLDALNLAKETAKAKFDESIDVAVDLGIDARKSDQLVRGSVVLPKGTGKSVRVAVFAQGAKAEEAKEAGADVVGFDDLADSIKGGKIDFDVVVASPDAMRIVGQLGQILGPRGLMPNPKVGTVTPDVAGAVKNAKAGQVQYRTDKNGIIQCTIGRASFDAEALREEIADVLSTMGLRLSPEKTLITHIDQGLDFLGWHIQRHRKRGTSRYYVYTYPSRKALTAAMGKVKAIRRRTATGLPLDDLLIQMNRMLVGWCMHFRPGVSSATFQYLSSYVWGQVMKWLRCKHRRISRRDLRLRYCGGGWWPAGEERALFDPGKGRTTRYRYRGTVIPSPWPTTG